MDTKIEEVVTPPAVIADAAKPKRQRLIKTPGEKAPKPAKTAKAPEKVAKQAEAPKVRTNSHVEAGVDTSAWSGPSDMINKNRQVRIMVRSNVTPDMLTDRQKKSLYALRKCYGGRGFPVKGFDNGVMAFLHAAGMINLTGGQQSSLDGKSYIVDGATAVIGKITAAGAKFGIA